MWFFGLLLAVAGLSSFRTADIAVSRPDRAQRRSLAKLERSYEYIRKMYVDSVDMAPLVEEAIRSMVQQLDPHTEYASAAEMAEFWSLYRGKFGGIGIQTQWIRDSLVVTSLLSGGAAEEAGVPGRILGRADPVGRAVQDDRGHADDGLRRQPPRPRAARGWWRPRSTTGSRRCSPQWTSTARAQPGATAPCADGAEGQGA